MPRHDFKKAAAQKINDYLITLVEKEEGFIRDQVRPSQFKRELGDWVGQETGSIPSIEIVEKTVGTKSPQMLIQCTEALMDKIKAQFAADIDGVERLRKLSEIPPGERNCWKPRP
jgi:hypothetical protein